MFNNRFKTILKTIKEYNTIVIARHIGPDPDALASQIALRDIIKLNYPSKKVYAVGATVSRFKYIGELDKVKGSLDNALLIILDVPQFDRVDGANKDDFSKTIKIDHHPINERVCDLEIVEESASSTCQIIADMVFKLKLKMNKEIAKTLFLGIVADSDRFLLSYTTPKTLVLTAKLIQDYKFELRDVYNNLYERGINERRFESYLIENLTITKNGFGYIKIDNEIIKKYHVDAGTASNMVNDLNFVKELKVWAFASFDEQSKIYKINIRSRGIVINEIAQKFNGGGHKFASGARIQTMEEVDKLFCELDKVCENS